MAVSALMEWFLLSADWGDAGYAAVLLLDVNAYDDLRNACVKHIVNERMHLGFVRGFKHLAWHVPPELEFF